jgi:hypothetical protein
MMRLTRIPVCAPWSYGTSLQSVADCLIHRKYLRIVRATAMDTGDAASVTTAGLMWAVSSNCHSDAPARHGKRAPPRAEVKTSES